MYPEVNGRDIPLLISFFTILKTCCDAGGSCREINLDHDTHLKLLKRFKTIGLSMCQLCTHAVQIYMCKCIHLLVHVMHLKAKSMRMCSTKHVIID